MAGRNFLFVPGPTNVPDRVLRAMAVAMEDHRSPSFPELTRACLNGLKPVFKTVSASPIIFPSSGTGCWEAALTNCLNPGDKVLIARFGQFSHLWADMCVRLGFDVELLETTWGEGAPLERYQASLSADKQHRIRAVLVCQNETATGVTSDVAGLRRAMDSAGHPALLFVDSVSALGQHRLSHGRMGRGCMRQRLAKGPDAAPPAWESPASAARRWRPPRARPRGAATSTTATWWPPTPRGISRTRPSIPMLYGLRESLEMLAEEGLDNVFHRHRYLAGGVRAAVLEGWKLRLCAAADRWHSDTVSAVMVPEGINGADVIARAFERYNLALGAGLSKVAGKLFRIGHMGDLNELMLLGAIAGCGNGHARRGA